MVSAALIAWNSFFPTEVEGSFRTDHEHFGPGPLTF